VGDGTLYSASVEVDYRVLAALGHACLDVLTQFWNVLRRDMSMARALGAVYTGRPGLFQSRRARR